MNPLQSAPSVAKPFLYQGEWEKLRTSDPDPKSVRLLANRISSAFMDNYYYHNRFDEDALRILCEMAAYYGNDDRGMAASSAIFANIIERLCDDFEDLQAETYNRVISHILCNCRIAPEGRWLDECLKAFSLNSFEDIFHRSEAVRHGSCRTFARAAAPEKVIVLSRVTIGADVAITSVLIQRLSDVFRHAEIVVVGNPKLTELFGGHPRVRVKPVHYTRRGGLLERFGRWPAVLEVVREETKKVDADKVILVDPDSRLSQLGVLPLIHSASYFFFNSRTNEASLARMSMAELANQWVDKVFSRSRFRYPKIWLPDKLLSRAKKFCGAVRESGRGRVTAVNLGVGGNDRKRVGQGFEEKLLLALLEDPQTAVLLDRGAGEKELAQTAALVEKMKGAGHAARETEFASLTPKAAGASLIAVETTMGEFAALISQCNEFIGYDSACQHIAAAAEVDCYTIFAGSNQPRFVQRWSASGPGISEIIHVDTLTHPSEVDHDEIVARILDRRMR